MIEAVPDAVTDAVTDAVGDSRGVAGGVDKAAMGDIQGNQHLTAPPFWAL